MASPTQPLPQAVPEARTMSSAARLLGVFTAPGSTFADIARAPHFILCWCLQAAVALGFGWEILHRVGAFTLAQQAMAQNASTRNLDPAALQRATVSTAKVMAITIYAGPVSTILIYLFFGAVFLGIANFLLGYEARYKQALAMVSHAYLVQTLYYALTVLVVALLADPASFQLTNPIGTNLGFFLDKASVPAFVYAFAVHLDIFSLWTVAVLALGLAKLGGKKGKFGGAFGAVFALWLLYCLVTSGITAAFA